MSSKGQQTQEKILSATLDLIERQGFHNTGLQQIIKASGAPKGSLYFHFPDGKDQIVALALEQGTQLIGSMIEHAFNMADNLEVAVGWLFDGLSVRLQSSAFEKGCPVATVALEVNEQHPDVLEACRKAFDQWQSAITLGLQAKGMSNERAASEAALMLSQLEGAMMLARIRRSREPMDQARDAVLSRLAPA
ncbi:MULTISPECIES: TetR/AcrR family transcriptional regulator [unclassified Ketobacter]|uniref:TetR/AcrR family transcriptional regulator n=1 Tax=unclassified Ketobacter TaxID=2639109 RepID=UPI000F28DEAA|nr:MULTISPECIES: TetR/AcrR family transcriptional regulator [unclassified Ketobacter]RLT87270.1 MAG: TetR/AcrR family transcriptional regulator [Ketobacter sp. GenoA1]RLT93384.1 MAG: TetR/AcrR family transcriptional regulator [Ketobacter sp.]